LFYSSEEVSAILIVIGVKVTGLASGGHLI